MSVTKAEIQSFTEVLYKKYGLDFTGYEPQSLQRRINRVLHVLKCGGVHELWSRMLKDKSLLSVFMDELSVGMTSMFREPHVWSGLRSLLYNYSNQKISIWSAGCSTGEEIYTLAIVLSEMGLLDSASIFASDMNKTAMATAKEGSYHKIKMIEYERKYREYNKFGDFSKYHFPPSGSHITMRKSLIKNVRFNYHNLISDRFTGSYDFIFCRNVMIYFDYTAKDRLIQQFYERLNPGGYLILGLYDSSVSPTHKNHFDSELSRLRIFRKHVKEKEPATYVS